VNDPEGPQKSLPGFGAGGLKPSSQRRPAAAKSPDWTARIMAVVGCLVAVLSLWVSWLAYAEQKRQFAITQMENVAIRLLPETAGKVKLTEIRYPFGTVVMTPWRVVVSNVGGQRLSIVETELSTGRKAGDVFYSGLNGGMYDAKQQAISLPVSLEPGDSVSYQLFVGVLVSPQVAGVLSKSRTDSLGFATQAGVDLASQRLDLFSNEISFSDSKSGVFFARGDSISPKYWLKVRTGRGNEFEGVGTAQSPLPIPPDSLRLN
jgi:hypothetical protein